MFLHNNVSNVHFDGCDILRVCLLLVPSDEVKGVGDVKLVVLKVEKYSVDILHDSKPSDNN